MSAERQTAKTGTRSSFGSIQVLIMMALFIALLLNKNMKGIGTIRTIYYIPSLFSGSVAVAILYDV